MQNLLTERQSEQWPATRRTSTAPRSHSWSSCPTHTSRIVTPVIRTLVSFIRIDDQIAHCHSRSVLVNERRLLRSTVAVAGVGIAHRINGNSDATLLHNFVCHPLSAKVCIEARHCSGSCVDVDFHYRFSPVGADRSVDKGISSHAMQCNCVNSNSSQRIIDIA